MALSSERQPLIPTYLYTSSFTSKVLNLQKMAENSSSILSPPPSASAPKGGFMIPAPSEPGKIELYSPQFYAACTAGGILSCGLTHMTVTPLDLVKCNMQVQIYSFLLKFIFLPNYFLHQRWTILLTSFVRIFIDLLSWFIYFPILMISYVLCLVSHWIRSAIPFLLLSILRIRFMLSVFRHRDALLLVVFT